MYDADDGISYDPDGRTPRGISFAEFVQHLEEHHGTQDTTKKGTDCIARTFLSVVSFAVFKHIVG